MKISKNLSEAQKIALRKRTKQFAEEIRAKISSILEENFQGVPLEQINDEQAEAVLAPKMEEYINSIADKLEEEKDIVGVNALMIVVSSMAEFSRRNG